MKEILILHYSQSGQLTRILENILRPLQQDPAVNLTFADITPADAYPFPWDGTEFFDTFPETFRQIPEAVRPLPDSVINKRYDLIILGYPIWFLSPARPVSSFLQTEQAARLFADTPVVTVIGCRNMWLQAQEKMKQLLLKVKAKLAGNIVLADRHLNHVSVITIQHWMFTGKKDSYLGIFPKPGVSEKDISQSVKFGEPIREALHGNNFGDLQKNLLRKGAVQVKSFLITVEKRAVILFDKWATFIRKKGNQGEAKRHGRVKMFKFYLLFAIWFIAPVVFILFLLTFLPMSAKIKRDKDYYSSVKLKTSKKRIQNHST